MYTLFQSHKKTFFGILFLVLFGATVVSANPPTSQTLNPNCTPTDPTCVIAVSGTSVWGAITGTLADQIDLQAALDAKQSLITSGSITNAMLAGSIASSKLIGTDIATVGTITSGTWQGTPVADIYIASSATWNAKQAAITTGTTAQYLRGDLSLASFPTLVSDFTNDASYIASSRSVSTGTGLAGGGDLSSNRTISLDINSLTTKNTALMADTIPVYDSATSSIKKISRSDFLQGITGAIIYQGSYNASTHTPAITDAGGSAGQEYVVTVAGTHNFGSGSITMGIGDFLIHNGSIWQLAPSSSAVSGVFGRTGSVTAQSGDYNTSQVTENTNLYFTNARAISSTLTGYTSGEGAISSADTILSAIQKINGNVGALVTGVSSVNGSTGAVSLASLTATDSTLTFSGSYNGATARTIGLNLTTANTWTGQQTFNTSSAIFGTAPTFSTMTAGSLLFAGASGVVSQDNSSLFWDNTNKRLGVGTATPTVSLHINGTSRFGGASDYMSISNSGILTLTGAAMYRVGDNKYAFQSATYTSAGLYFNASALSLDLMNTLGVASARIGINGSNTYFGVDTNSNSFVGIGTTNPIYRLDVLGGATTPLRVSSTSANSCTFSTGTGSWSCSSDVRLKHDIVSIDDIGTAKILSLRPVTFHYNWQQDNEPVIPGFIAQEFETVFPELVTTDTTTGYKTLSYTPLIPYAIKAIQDLNIQMHAMLPTETDQSMYAKIQEFLRAVAEQSTIAIDFITAKKVTTDELQTKKLCIDDLCITKEQLQQVLQNTQIQQQPQIQETPAILEVPVVESVDVVPSAE